MASPTPVEAFLSETFLESRTDPPDFIVVVTDSARQRTVEHIRRTGPESRLLVFDETMSISERVSALSGEPRPELIIESGSRIQTDKIECLNQLLPFVAVGGRYVVDELQTIEHPDWKSRRDGHPRPPHSTGANQGTSEGSESTPLVRIDEGGGRRL